MSIFKENFLALSSVHIFNFLVNKYKSSINFSRFSGKKILELVLFSRDVRVTKKINIFFWLRLKHQQKYSDSVGNVRTQLPKAASNWLHKAVCANTLCLTTLYTEDCSTYSYLICFLLLLNARGRSFLSSSSPSSSSSSPELQSFCIFFVDLFSCIYLFTLFKD